MTAYLMIQNPGVAPQQAFTLLGASTKRDGSNANTIGKFGTGNKHGIAVLLRNQLNPVIYAGNLKLEFGTRAEVVNDGLKDTTFNRVVVQYGGKDLEGKNRSSTEDLGFVLEHGSDDWLGVDLSLREFVSNSIDRSIEEGEFAFVQNFLKDKDEDFRFNATREYSWEYNQVNTALVEYRKTAKDYENVVVEVVNESQVRAKSGHTRVFVPLVPEVLTFFNDLGKWFLHFSEPELLNSTLLPKKNRNLGDRTTAVIYRRGVRVREFESSDTPSLFDYNLENLKLDESRRVDDWYVTFEAAKAFGNADRTSLARLWQSFLDGGKFWEHSFHHGLDYRTESQDQVWNDAFEDVAGEFAVLSTEEGGQMAARKGHKVVVAPQQFVQAAEKRGLRTPAKVLTDDDRAGRTVFDATPDAIAAVEFVWELCVKYGVTNGKSKPFVKTFRKIMDGGGQTLGFYKDNTVYLNQDIASNGSLSLGWHGLTQQLLATSLEEVAHHVTGAADNSRDFQDFLLNLVIYSAKEVSGI
jgi:hypothetical protein